MNKTPDKTPAVSVITALYNSADFIGATIESVRAQSFSDWEMVLVDDCSTDRSVEIVAAYAAADPRIRLLRLTENGGPAVARNRAIEEARGRYIAFLDSDDRWRSEKLERQLAFMHKHGHAFTHTWYEKCAENGEGLGTVMRPPSELDYNELLKSNRIGCLTVVYDSEVLGKVFMPLIRKRQDYGLWLKIMRRGVTARCLAEDLAIYRVRAGSVSQNKLELIKYNWALYRRIEKLSFFRSTWYLLYVIIRKLRSG